MSRAITDKKDDKTTNAFGGTGPSVQVEDEPTFARICALVGAFCVVVGGVALYINLYTEKKIPIGPGSSSLLLSFGALALFFHAAYDRNAEFRRVYQFLGLLAAVVGAVFCFLPYSSGNHAGQVGDLLGPGFLLLCAGLLLLLFTLRHETAELARNWLQLFLLAAGAALSVIGLFGSNLYDAFLTPVGLVLALVGLVYLAAFAATRGASDDLAYRTALAIGAVGAIVFFIALGKSAPGFWIVEILIVLALAVEVGTRVLVSWGLLAPETRVGGMPLSRLRLVTWLAFIPLFLLGLWLVYGSGWVLKATDHVWADYAIPQGVLLMGVGLIYVCVSYFSCSDQPLAVLTRRELAAFAYTPVAYILLFVSSGFAAVSYYLFALPLLAPDKFGIMFEPIVKNLLAGNNFPAIIVTISVVPAITMRLFSEERRSGTLEVLLTTPVSDVMVILSKFLASWLVFMLVWAPFGLYLIGLRIGAGKDFDYRPLLSYFIALAISGANFVGMGLFFSSLTKNQIVSFFLTFVGMLFLFSIFFMRLVVHYQKPGNPWETVFLHMSYHDLWGSAMEGKLQPKFLVFPASLAVLWLFLTAKVLEVRKWS
jgi:ABC-2 type transport system permease protein